MTVVKTDRAGALQPRHSRHQIRVRSFHHQMIMVSHETKGMSLLTSLPTRFGKGPGYSSRSLRGISEGFDQVPFWSS